MGGPEPVHRRWQRDADSGLGEPSADDHGPGVEAGGAPGSQAGRHTSNVTAAALATATKLIKDIFKADYADALKTPEKKSPLAQKLLQQAAQPGNDPAPKPEDN